MQLLTFVAAYWVASVSLTPNPVSSVDAQSYQSVVHEAATQETVAQEALSQGHYQMVLDWAKSKNPQDNWRYAFYRGTAQLGLANLEQAQIELDSALAQDKNQPDIWIQLAVLEQELGNHMTALQYLEVARRLAPDNGYVELNRAYSLEHLGRYRDALRAYQKFLTSANYPAANKVHPKIIRRVAVLAQQFAS